LGADCPLAVPIAVVPFSALILSLRQGFNWLVGFQTEVYFVDLFSVATLWALRRQRVGWPALIGAAVLAAFANFSQGAGILIWPFAGAALWPLGYRRWSFVAFWSLAAIASLSTFFAGFALPPPPPLALSEWLRYALTFIGSPFVRQNAGAEGAARII